MHEQSGSSILANEVLVVKNIINNRVEQYFHRIELRLLMCFSKGCSRPLAHGYGK